MARKDITDLQVCQAYAASQASRATQEFNWPDKILATSGQPEKVCFAAMERAFGRGLIDYGMSLRGGWLTGKGKKYLEGCLATDGNTHGVNR